MNNNFNLINDDIDKPRNQQLLNKLKENTNLSDLFHQVTYYI